MAVTTKPVNPSMPIWEPIAGKGYQLKCPLCQDTHVRVNGAMVEVGGLELGGAGRVVLSCNGHADSICQHRFTVVINFSDGGIICAVDPHVTPFLKTQPQ